MKYLLLLLIVISTNCVAQKVYVKYNTITKISDQIPYDQAFTLEISPVNISKISDILFFEVNVVNGKRVLYDAKPGNYRSSFAIEKGNHEIIKDKLIIEVPALKPEKDFKVEVRTAISGSSTRRLYSILKDIDKNYGASAGNISTDLVLIAALDKLKDSLSAALRAEFDIKTPFSAFPHLITAVRDKFYLPVATEFKVFMDTTSSNSSLAFQNFLTQQDVQTITKSVSQDLPFAQRLYVLQKILDDQQNTQVLNGLTGVDYNYPVKNTVSYDFRSRLKNLSNSIAYFDSLLIVTNYLKAVDPPALSGIKGTLHNYLINLKGNRKVLNDNNNAIEKNLLTNNVLSALNAYDGSTISANLQTTSKRRFTLEAGFSNIWAYNSTGEQKRLEKPMIGITYHFRPQTDIAKLKRLPQPEAADNSYTHALESKYKPEYRWGISLGLGLGNSKQKDLDSVYGGFTFMLGPSYQIFNFMRISGGGAAYKRVSSHPLQSDKSTHLGYYASVSLDYDLLDAVKGITSMIFK